MKYILFDISIENGSSGWKMQDYIEGMMTYYTWNQYKCTLSAKKTLYKSTCDEFKEFIAEIYAWHFLEAYYEFVDVVHCVIQLIAVFLVGHTALQKRYLFVVLYLLAYQTAKKHGLRYKETGCIRNHRSGNEHRCQAKKLPDIKNNH